MALKEGALQAVTKAEVHGNEIVIGIETKLADSENSESKCGDAYLGQINEGDYVVFYSGGNNKKVLIGHVSALL